jgi:hypothetical protein
MGTAIRESSSSGVDLGTLLSPERLRWIIVIAVAVLMVLGYLNDQVGAFLRDVAAILIPN